MWHLSQREFRRTLQEVIRIEKVAALEIPIKNEDRIWQALQQAPLPPLPGVLDAWDAIRKRRHQRAYGTTYVVGRDFYTTASTPFFCILLPDGTVAATFGSSRDDIAPLVNRIAIDRAFKAFGYEFPGSLRDETAFTIAWDLLTQGDRDSTRPDVTGILSAHGDVLRDGHDRIRRDQLGSRNSWNVHAVLGPAPRNVDRVSPRRPAADFALGVSPEGTRGGGRSA